MSISGGPIPAGAPVNGRVDAVAEAIGFGVGEGAAEGADVEAHQHVLLVGGHSEPLTSWWRQRLVVGLGEDAEGLEERGVVVEALSYAVAELFDVVALADRDREVAAHGGEGGDRAVGVEVVEHLGGDAGIGRPEQADVGDPLAHHEQAVEAHPERKAGPGDEAGSSEDLGMSQPALPYFDPLIARSHVDLPTVDRVGVYPGLPSPLAPREERVGQELEHLVQVVVTDGVPGDPPDVELVGGPGVQPVDGVPSVRDARADEEHVVGRVCCQGSEGGGDHGARMASQHTPIVHIARVAGVAGHRVGRIAEAVIVVGQRHDAGAACDPNVAAPGVAQGPDSQLDEELDAVRPFGRVGQVSDGEILGELVWAECSGHVAPCGEGGWRERRPSARCNARRVSYRETVTVALRPEAGRGRRNRRQRGARTVRSVRPRSSSPPLLARRARRYGGSVQLGFAVPVSGSWATPANCVEISRKAEELGYTSLWSFQRLLSPLDGDAPALAPAYHSVHDPLATLAYLAGQTTTARLGVAVVNMPYYAPIVLAKLLTTIDHLSGGRLDVGLGIGWSPHEFEAVGMPLARRGARAEDFIRCLRAIWTGGVVDYEGTFYRVPRSRVDPKPVQRPHPPILLGGGAEAALGRAGRVAAGWISASRADLTRIDESIAVARTAAAGAGRDPDELRFICRGVVRVRSGERAPLVGSFDEIRADLADLAAKGITETFIDLNFDPEIGSPDADPTVSMRRAHEVLEALTPA